MNRPFRQLWDWLFAQQVDSSSAHNPPVAMVLESHKHNMTNTPINWAAVGVVVTIILAVFAGGTTLTKAAFAHLTKTTEILTQLLSRVDSIVAWMGEAKAQFNTATAEIHDLKVGQTELRSEFHSEARQLSERLSRVEDTLFTRRD